MTEAQEPIIVDFPLRGQWVAPHTPGDKVPSHGSNQLGQRYAYDFMHADDMRVVEKAGKKSLSFSWRYLIFGQPLAGWTSWGQPVYAPADGTVVAAVDSMKERRYLHLISDMAVVLKNALFVKEETPFQKFLGNYIIMQIDGAYALFAHLQSNSVQVATGQKVKAGDTIAGVGHSGNSTAPHLHFHLMDSPDIWTAQGIPCAFARYEVFDGSTWAQQHNAIPVSTDIVRVD